MQPSTSQRRNLGEAGLVVHDCMWWLLDEEDVVEGNCYAVCLDVVALDVMACM